VRAPKRTVAYVTLDGAAHRARPGQKVRVGEAPILFRSRG